MKIILDFETANTENPNLLKEGGAEVYAQHPATEILCLCYRSEGGDIVGTWLPGDDPWALRALIEDEHVTFEAHNSWFEQMVWQYIMVERYTLPPIPLSRWSCSQAAAYYKGLPGALEKGAKLLHIQNKDMDGSKLTIALSKPMTKARQKALGTKYDRTPETIARVVQYCATDCDVEHALSTAVGPLSQYERAVWELDQRINHRGVRLDLDFVRAASKIVADATAEMTEEFRQITGGLNPTQVEKVQYWFGANGLPLENLTKTTLAEYVDENGVPTTAGHALPPHVLRAIQIRQQTGAASIKKLPVMLASVGRDGRSRGLVQYHGAGTGRWAGRLWQPHNLPRGLITVRNDRGKMVPPNPNDLYNAIMTGDHRFVAALFGDAIRAVATNMRSAVIPSDGHLFMDADFSGIEMRGVLGVAGQHDKTELLATGADVYLDMACDIYRAPKGSLTKDDVEKRTIGKNTVLGCGFGMGGGTFHDRYCPHMTEEFAHEVVNTYRTVWAPEVPVLWGALESAAYAAVYNKGDLIQAYSEDEFGEKREYGIWYQVVEYEGRAWLACYLPDGQTMFYFDPFLDVDKFGRGVIKSRSGTGVDTLTRSVLVENVIQKLARGFLVEAMFRLEAAGYPVVMHIHDSILVEVPKERADFKAYSQIMAEPTATARHYKIPIAVEGFVADRWRK